MRSEEPIRVSLGRQMRWVRCAVCVAGLSWVAALCCGAAGVGVDTSPARTGSRKTGAQKKVVALSPWEQAEQGRDALEAIPEETRTRGDYTRAMDGYRAIYHANPADLHAAAAVNAVAELLVEQGRALGGPKGDAKILKAAVGQYEFLRTQYPASSLGAQALLAEAEIEQNDLGDAAAAKEKYKLLLKEHARSEQAEEAKAGLASLEQGAVVSSQLSAKTTGRRDRTPAQAVDGSDSKMNEARGSVTKEPGPVQRSAVSGQQSAGGGASLPAMAQTSGVVGSTYPTPPVRLTGTPARDTTAVNGEAGAVPGKRALVTGIRHWSTATYTRVAIDLGDGVTYEAARVPNPDRIYFDLHGARLAQELVGKSFAVTDDGFLKKVRASQYSDDVTRVVLDVNDVTEYSAFLLPNPYRLIIDIHGGKAAGNKVQGTGNTETEAAEETPAPRAATTVKATAARPVPNAVATKNASTTSEVADLSEMPGRVEATTKPTSQPISAVVEGSRKDGAAGLPGASLNAAPDEPTPRDSATMNGVPAVPDGAKRNRKRVKAADSSTSTSNAVVADATPARAAVPTAEGETSLVRALGLKIGRIVIDAGHGGHDSGTLGLDGIQEKDVVLDVALRLGKLLHDRLGAEIIYTRSDDTFIPLETRTAIANKAQADLFLSIHANSSSEPSARGVETYYLNFTSDPTALDVAARENAVSDQSIHQLSDLVKKIAMKDKIAESREFASDVEGSLYAGLQKGNAGLKDRGVKKAPFVVLIGANMPSILAEISFVTNPKDAEQLQEPDYRQRVAESLYKGVARYEGGLSGAKPMGVATERAAVGQ
jgi:N-acetylmuramoyl-L-alanine amidase